MSDEDDEDESDDEEDEDEVVEMPKTKAAIMASVNDMLKRRKKGQCTEDLCSSIQSYHSSRC